MGFMARPPSLHKDMRRDWQRDSVPACLSKQPGRQMGASMVEFMIVSPFLLFFGLGIMQMGLVYHAKSMLNYATFEAARTGAVTNAQIDEMRKELGYRMAPIFGGDGTMEKGLSAIARSAVAAQDLSTTKIVILNPTAYSFEQHGSQKTDEELGSVVAIPNSHLRSRNHDEVKTDGLNIQDANLLKIEVTYGYPLKIPILDMEVPGAKLAMRLAMLKADPDNWMYYSRGLFPIKSTATVRMQSEAYQEQTDPVVVATFDSLFDWNLEEIELQQPLVDDNPGGTGGTGEGPTGGTGGGLGGACDTNGVPLINPIQTEDPNMCSVPFTLNSATRTTLYGVNC